MTPVGVQIRPAFGVFACAMLLVVGAADPGMSRGRPTCDRFAIVPSGSCSVAASSDPDSERASAISPSRPSCVRALQAGASEDDRFWRPAGCTTPTPSSQVG